MKKFLLPVLGMALSLGVSAQESDSNIPVNLEITSKAADRALPNSLNKSAVVEDTLGPILTGVNCQPVLTYYSIGNDIVSGTFDLGNNLIISDVAQLLNASGRNVTVESIFTYVAKKAPGSNSGSFNAEIYDTIGGPSPLRPDYTAEATSNSITYANIDTANLINKFTFSTPYQTTEPFWASIAVENGSDTLALFTSSAGCGGSQPTALMNVNDTSWFYYHSVFTSGGAPLDFALWIFAEVDTAGSGVGLDRNLISNKGLKFYPNPATDYATIEFAMPNESDVTLVIQDMTGREIYRKEQSFNNGERSFNLDLSSYNKGAYTYQVIGKRRQLNGVFVKQ